MTGREARQLKPGMRVYWNDPAFTCSRWWEIHAIEVEYDEDGRYVHDPVVKIEDKSGSYVEAFAHELSFSE